MQRAYRCLHGVNDVSDVRVGNRFRFFETSSDHDFESRTSAALELRTNYIPAAGLMKK
jgi:hypothetical protein